MSGPIWCSLTAADFDIGEPLRLRVDPGSDLREAERRMTRTPTLDGGTAITDGGFVVSDNTLTLTLQDVTQAQADRLRELTERPGAVTASLDGRVWRALLQRITLGPESARITLAITARLDA